jgi:hypothetical protein
MTILSTSSTATTSSRRALSARVAIFNCSQRTHQRYTALQARKHWMDARRIHCPCCTTWPCCRKEVVTSRGSCAGAVAGAGRYPRQPLRDYVARDYSARWFAVHAAPATQRSVSGGSARRRALRKSTSGADINLPTPILLATYHTRLGLQLVRWPQQKIIF